MAPRYRFLVGAFGSGYALVAMMLSGMLYIPSRALPIPYFLYVVPRGPGASWAYPAIFAGGPYFQVDFPFLSTILMTLTAAGVGLGMSLAVFLGARLIRYRASSPLRPTATGTVVGLSPALIALVTVGACCSTTAAATAGIGLAAHSFGLSAVVGFANLWYLGMFQVGIVYLALLGQEHLLAVYPVPSKAPAPPPEPAEQPSHETPRSAGRPENSS